MCFNPSKTAILCLREHSFSPPTKCLFGSPAGSACGRSSESVSGEEGERGGGLQRARPVQLQLLSCQQLLQRRLGQPLLHLPRRSVRLHFANTIVKHSAGLSGYFKPMCKYGSQCCESTAAYSFFSPLFHRLLWHQLHRCMLTEPL